MRLRKFEREERKFFFIKLSIKMQNHALQRTEILFTDELPSLLRRARVTCVGAEYGLRARKYSRAFARNREGEKKSHV